MISLYDCLIRNQIIPLALKETVYMTVYITLYFIFISQKLSIFNIYYYKHLLIYNKKVN